ncbi:MAG: ATP-dependent Clp protease adapter ClpS [Myxococcales bacterium]|nr:ATP-dependent Clp protease adapter ClpS [Myxococcota bacterium]MDW8281445.1 ATP-dependent Clp protease adapter ClpS [Myxococcales bacterium]
MAERRQFQDERDTGVITQSKKRLKPPPLYKVLLHNDDYTTREFVVMILQAVFNKSETEATQIMLHVHHNGVGVAGIYPYEIAETKAEKTMSWARKYEFPLRCTLEPETDE